MFQIYLIIRMKFEKLIGSFFLEETRNQKSNKIKNEKMKEKKAKKKAKKMERSKKKLKDQC